MAEEIRIIGLHGMVLSRLKVFRRKLSLTEKRFSSFHLIVKKNNNKNQTKLYVKTFKYMHLDLSDAGSQ